jgi:tetratricopeptide (TPR) repeat protein
MQPLRIDFHPVYIEELNARDASFAARDANHVAKVMAAIGLGPRLDLLKERLAALPDDRERVFAILVCLVFYCDRGVKVDDIAALVEEFCTYLVSPGERYQFSECLSALGRNHRQAQDHPRAIALYRDALQILDGLPERATTSALYFNQGVACEQAGDHEAATRAFREAARIDKALGRRQEARDDELRAAHNEAISALSSKHHVAVLTEASAKARQQGNMAEALQAYLLAMQHATRSKDLELVALAARNLGSIFFYQGEFERAREVLAGVLATIPANHASRAVVLLLAALGNVQSALHRPDDAMDVFRRAVSMADDHGWPDEADKARYGLSQLCIDRRDYEAALPLLRESLAFRSKAGQPIEHGNVLNQLGFVTYQLHRYEESLDFHRQALRIRKGSDVRGAAESAHSLAMLFDRLGDRRRALAFAVRAVRWYETIRHSISTGSESRESFFETVARDYDTAAQLACSMGHGSIAWYVLQRLQNRTLIDGLARGDVERPASVPEKEFEHERELLQRLRFAGADVLRTHDALRDLRGMYQTIRRTDAAYARWRTGEAPSSRELLARRGQGTAYLELLEYNTAAGANRWEVHLLGVCAVAGDRRLRTLTSTAEISHDPPQPVDYPALRASVERIFAQVREIRGGPGSLFVVAHGPMAKEPIHAIPAGDRPLIACQPVRYLPHSAFFGAERWFPPAVVDTFAIFGDSRGDLAFAAAEAQKAADIVAVEPILGRRVTRQALSEALGSFDLVHVAGHAVFDTEDPMQSGLVASDGVLTANDLRTVPIHASVVVLNGCDSGVQRAGLGSEMNGFIRALLLGGVRHVVCTLAGVDDEIAGEFAAELYSGLRHFGGRDIVTAVWHAQRTLADSYRDAPHLWNPFILVG